MTFLSPEWHALLPFMPIIIVVITVLLVMLGIALKRSHWLTGTISVIGLNLAVLALLGQMLGWWLLADVDVNSKAAYVVGSMFAIDQFAQFNMLVILISALACCTLAYAYFRDFRDHKEELYLLMLISTAGAMLMVSAQNLASFFMSLELLSVPLYGMLAYAFMRSRSLESGLKYLVLSATASATLLMGMAFIYAVIGSLDFRTIGFAVSAKLGLLPVDTIPPQLINAMAAQLASFDMPLLVAGSALMMFGIAFKLSAAPFHKWTPDVYQGAPAPVATFLASVSKVAMMALAVRFLSVTLLVQLPAIQLLLMIMATLSILVGNLLAVRQTNLKRLLGYSSIAHMGYVLVVIASVGVASPLTSNMYMAMYALSSIGAFGVITLMSSTSSDIGEADELCHYQGLFWRRPVLTGVMTVMLLSLAGIPLTAGFITKFFAIFQAVEAGRWFLAAMVIVGSAIGLYYYLRVMLTMFKRPREIIKFDATWQWGLQMGGLMVLMVTLVVLYFGVLPNDLIMWSQQAKIW